MSNLQNKAFVFKWYRPERNSNPMSSPNQKKPLPPPPPHSPVNNNQAVDNVGKQAFAMMNNQKDVNEWEIVEFTKEEVDVLLNDKFQGKTFDSKGKHEWMREYIKQLKVCIKWFQNGLEELVKEKDYLHTMLDSSERKCVEAEALMNLKEEKLNSTIIKLENDISSLKESLANEESQKIDAIDCHKREKEARMVLEKNQDSLVEALHNALTSKEKILFQVKMQEERYKMIQEYNIQLQKEITSAKDSRDEAVKQKDNAVHEVEVLRAALQQLMEDRERHLSQIHDLNSEIVQYKQSIGDTAALCDNLRLKSSALEETCSDQTEQISRLQNHLTAANQKLKMANSSTSEIRTKFEYQKRIISELEDQLWEKCKLGAGERFRK